MKKIFVLLLVFPFWGITQEKSNIKWGKITINDFNVKSEFTDSVKADAIVIADVGESEFISKPADQKIAIQFKHKKRMKIFNKNGNDIASIKIYLYRSLYGGADEKITSLTASTYNIENGRVIETKLEKSQIFEEKISKSLVVQKFTFPSVKEGCIIEFSYTLESEFLYNLQPWRFQSSYPIIHSEYTVTIPEFFNYVNVMQGNQIINFDKQTKNIKLNFRTESVVKVGLDDQTFGTFNNRTEAYSLEGTAEILHWVTKNSIPLKRESYTTSIENYIGKVEFQLQYIKYPDTPPVNYTNTWEKLSKELIKNKEFGLVYNNSSNLLNDEVQKIVLGESNKLLAAKKIYYHISNKFTSTNYGIYATKSQKEVLQSQNGNVADINFLLISALKTLGIDVKPAILSTTENGLINPTYPIINKFNYVICLAKIDTSVFFLDASQTFLPFGQLLPNCYNGYSQIIAETTSYFELNSSELLEQTTTNVFIDNNETGGLVGEFSTEMGIFQSIDYRKTLQIISEEKLAQSLKKQLEILNINTEKIDINTERNIENQCGKLINFKTVFSDDLIYFNPLIINNITENYFSATKRSYPVEFPYQFINNYSLTMEMPIGYTIDELPKSMKVKLPEYDSFFEYIISVKENKIYFRSKISIGTTTISNNDYESIRNFYAMIVKKHAEQIVFKKIK